MWFIVKNLMLFDHFRSHFAFWAPKWTEFDRFYKVFWSTFFDAPKWSRTNAFLTFRKVAKRLQLLVKNLMLFDTFERQNAFLIRKVFINDRFYKVFWSTFFDAPKCSRTNAFLTFCTVVKRLQLLLKNLMLFWYFPGPFCKKGSKSINERQVL